MRQLHDRLKGLKEEFAKGQQRLDELEQKQIQMTRTLLRISGAIQVLEELVQAQDPQAVFQSNGQPEQPDEVAVGQ
jgi:hypothetical protein